MSVIKHAIDRVLLTIPKHILKLGFLEEVKAYRIETTLEQQISNLVIDNIVLTDINLLGGITVKIPIDKCYTYEYRHASNVCNRIIKVPLTLTGNKKIISPISVVVGLNESGNGIVASGNNLLDSAITGLNYANAESNGQVFSNLDLIATNTILVNDNVYSISSGYIEVVLENNKNLSNIKRGNQLDFSEMVILATKSYIYNKLIIDLDKGSLYYGHDLNKVSDIISSYETAYPDYSIFLKEKWAKISFMNDSVAMSDFLALMINPT